MVKDTRTFGAGRWLAEILQSLGSYRTIHQFITSPEALTAYLDTVEVVTGGDNGVQVTDDPERVKHWHEMIGADVKKAGSFYDSQMVVLAVVLQKIFWPQLVAALRVVKTQHLV